MWWTKDGPELVFLVHPHEKSKMTIKKFDTISPNTNFHFPKLQVLIKFYRDVLSFSLFRLIIVNNLDPSLLTSTMIRKVKRDKLLNVLFSVFLFNTHRPQGQDGSSFDFKDRQYEEGREET